MKSNIRVGKARRAGAVRGSGAASVSDVARSAKVSLGTVSRVMNGQVSVNPELRRRVLVAARRIGFVPRLHASHLAIITGRHNPVMPMGYTDIMTSLIERFASRAGFTVELIEEQDLDRVYDCRVGAAIGVVFTDRIQQLQEVPNLPVITVNHPMAGKGVHSVYTDHFEQGVMATEYLVDRGHRRIAFLADLPDEWGAAERRRGYADVLARTGLPFDGALLRYSGEEPVHDIVQRWVRGGVTAILNLSEDTAPQVLHILSNILGLRIGQDISTITLEDVPIYQFFAPPQTVVRQPLEELARVAVESAVRLSAEGRAGNGHGALLDVCLHGELVERDSVSRLRAVAPA